VAIYSSGSELAQRLLFGSTQAGDLTPFISGFFDTTIGPKTSVESYRRIAVHLSRPAERVLFVSDAPSEIAAARSAGCPVLLCVRPGNRIEAEPVAELPTVHTFDEIG
jgi:enolase-phosphatase E1